MSLLTEEMRSVIVELASELGEGLEATIHETPSTASSPSANAPGASTLRTFDPATQSYDNTAAGAFRGSSEDVATTVKVPPLQPLLALTDDQGTQEGDAVLILPRTDRADGTELVPKVGHHVEVRGEFWQVIRVQALGIGDGVAGHALTLLGGGRPWP